MSGTPTYDRNGLLGEIRRGFRLDWHGIHGAHHWGRVRHHARALQGRYYDLGEKQLSQLTLAIRHHSGGEVSTDATIQCCWDADRLDIGRVGIRPHPRFLSDHAAARIGPAYGWSVGRRRKA